MCALYFGESKGGARCPGEDECAMFQSAGFVEDAGPDGQPIGKSHVCAGCELRQTKPPKLTHIDSALEAAELAQLVDQIETLAAEQQAGFTLTPADLSPLEFELLCYWHATVRSIERQQALQLNQMLGALFSR